MYSKLFGDTSIKRVYSLKVDNDFPNVESKVLFFCSIRIPGFVRQH